MLKISVIIPTYNEERNLEKLIHSLERTAAHPDWIEIIVADFSSDRTPEIAMDLNVKLVKCIKQGRGNQMNEGSSYAEGDVLYFLHCDTLPPNNWDHLIREAIGNGYDSGCFRMKFDWDHWFLRLSGYFTRFNYFICRGGDQSLFVKKDLFELIGPFEAVLMEDLELIAALMKKSKFGIIPAYVVTSARRYKRNGVFYLQFHFAFLHLLRAIGANKQKQERYYSRFIS